MNIGVIEIAADAIWLFEISFGRPDLNNDPFRRFIPMLTGIMVRIYCTVRMPSLGIAATVYRDDARRG